MEVFDAVSTVLAVRQFQEKPIPEEIVHQIVEAAHLTASSMNGQPWHFIKISKSWQSCLLATRLKHSARAKEAKAHWRNRTP